MKIYLAARYSRHPEMRSIRDDLEDLGGVFREVGQRGLAALLGDDADDDDGGEDGEVSGAQPQVADAPPASGDDANENGVGGHQPPEPQGDVVKHCLQWRPFRDPARRATA